MTVKLSSALMNSTLDDNSNSTTVAEGPMAHHIFEACDLSGKTELNCHETPSTSAFVVDSNRITLPLLLADIKREGTDITYEKTFSPNILPLFDLSAPEPV